MSNPIQPILKDADGDLKFQENKIVKFLLESSKVDMNQILCMAFSPEDRQQFIQLIGMSLEGYAYLPYVTDEAYDAAVASIDDSVK